MREITKKLEEFTERELLIKYKKLFQKTLLTEYEEYKKETIKRKLVRLDFNIIKLNKQFSVMEDFCIRHGNNGKEVIL